MTYILIVAGNGIRVLCGRDVHDRAREEHRDMTRTELLGSTEPRAPGLRPGVLISALRNLTANAAKTALRFAG